MHSGQNVWLWDTGEKANKVIIVKKQLDVAVPMSIQKLVEVLPYLYVVAVAKLVRAICNAEDIHEDERCGMQESLKHGATVGDDTSSCGELLLLLDETISIREILLRVYAPLVRTKDAIRHQTNHSCSDRCQRA